MTIFDVVIFTAKWFTLTIRYSRIPSRNHYVFYRLVGFDYVSLVKLDHIFLFVLANLDDCRVLLIIVTDISASVSLSSESIG